MENLYPAFIHFSIKFLIQHFTLKIKFCDCKLNFLSERLSKSGNSTIEQNKSKPSILSANNSDQQLDIGEEFLSVCYSTIARMQVARNDSACLINLQFSSC